VYLRFLNCKREVRARQKGSAVELKLAAEGWWMDIWRNKALASHTVTPLFHCSQSEIDTRFSLFTFFCCSHHIFRVFYFLFLLLSASWQLLFNDANMQVHLFSWRMGTNFELFITICRPYYFLILITCLLWLWLCFMYNYCYEPNANYI
jgi:hypothetical protein